jgi:hypothetical protein
MHGDMPKEYHGFFAKTGICNIFGSKNRVFTEKLWNFTGIYGFFTGLK